MLKKRIYLFLIMLILSIPLLTTNSVVFAGDIRLPESNIVASNINAWETAESIIDKLLGFLGLIAVAVILYGGFRWMTAGGNEDAVKKAKHTLTAGIIGLVIVLAAWGIARFVIDLLPTREA